MGIDIGVCLCAVWTPPDNSIHSIYVDLSIGLSVNEPCDLLVAHIATIWFKTSFSLLKILKIFSNARYKNNFTPGEI